MRIAEALSDVQRLYIDTSPFIYYVEEHAAYADKMERIFDEVDARPIEVFTSVVTLTETLTKPLKTGDEAVVEAYRTLLRQTRHIHLLPISVRIAEGAADLRSRYNLRTPDALHVASALDVRCAAFLTNDLKLQQVSEVRVVTLDELELEAPESKD